MHTGWEQTLIALIRELHLRRGPTHVSYSIVRLPGDEQLHTRVLDLELTLVSALRRIDPTVEVHLAGNALREIDRTRTSS